MKSRFLNALALLLLAGCAGAFPGNPQGYGGINKTSIGFSEAGMPTVERIDGKGRETIHVVFERAPDGTLKAEYDAGGVTVDGQALRAAVEDAVSEDVKEVFPGIVDAIISAIVPLL